MYAWLHLIAQIASACDSAGRTHNLLFFCLLTNIASLQLRRDWLYMAACDFGFCVPGALDLKPDDFQAAFASGVVGALTASQQVIPTRSSKRQH